MDIFDSEINIISAFQDVVSEEVLLLPENSEEAEEVFLSLNDEKEWAKWTNSSAKGALPPDFYCDSKKLMMEVMRVDDHEYISKKGAIVNQTRVRETELMRELKEKGMLKAFPNATPVVIADTKLPTEQDHSYKMYLESFNRIVGKHLRKIEKYKENHSSYKMIFFILDESSAYFESLHKPINMQEGDINKGSPHLWFMDENFINSIIKSDLDFVIWYAPYKYCSIFENGEQKRLDLPTAVVIDIKNFNEKTIKYCTDKMISTEI